MTKKRNKPGSGDDADAITSQAYVQVLKRQIRQLNKLPDDFRDLTAGGRDWETYAGIMGPVKRKEMETWWKGSTLILAPIVDLEYRIFYSNVIETDCPGSIKTFEDLVITIHQAEMHNCSWIYLPDLDRGFIASINMLLSRLHRPVRVRGKLLSEFGGKPINATTRTSKEVNNNIERSSNE